MEHATGRHDVLVSDSSACLVMLPPEIVRAVLSVLDNVDFAACMRASHLFHVHTWSDYIERRYGRMAQPILVESAPLEAIEYLYARGRFHPTAEDVAHAARNRRADLFAWLDARQKYRTCACPIRRGLAQGGDIEFARRFFDDASRPALVSSMEDAACKGQVGMLAWLAERTSPTPDELARVASAAMEEGYLEAVEWALHSGASGWEGHGSLCRAMRKMDPAVVARWVTEKGCERHVSMYDLFDPSGRACRASLMDWKASIARHHNWDDPNNHRAMRYFANEAVLCARLDILRDIEARKPSSIYLVSGILSHAAAKNGHMDVAEWVLGNDPHADALKDAMKGSIVGGQWHILRSLAARYASLLTERVQVWKSVVSETAYVGIEALERVSAVCGTTAAMFTDASWISWAIASVLYGNGSLDTIKYLCERHGTTVGIPAHTDSVDTAAKCGDLDTLRWLHERLGWPCSHKTLFHAVYHGHPAVVRYLCGRDADLLQQMDDTGPMHAAYRGYIDVFKALHDHGLDELSLIRWSVVEDAAGRYRADFVAWLCDTYPLVCERAMTCVQVSRCSHGCDSPPLMLGDVDLDWIRVMGQYAFGK